MEPVVEISGNFIFIFSKSDKLGPFFSQKNPHYVWK